MSTSWKLTPSPDPELDPASQQASVLPGSSFHFPHSLGGRRIGVKGGESERGSGPKRQSHLSPLSDLESIPGFPTHMLPWDLPPAASRGPEKPLPRPLTPAHTPSCLPSRRERGNFRSIHSQPYQWAPRRKTCSHEPDRLGQAPRKPSRGTCPPLQLGSPGPTKGGLKAPMFPCKTHPAISASHPAGDWKWAPGTGAQRWVVTAVSRLAGTLSHQTEGWALFASSVLQSPEAMPSGRPTVCPACHYVFARTISSHPQPFFISRL